MAEIVVFAGPCIVEPDAELKGMLSQVRVYPPAQRGDFLRALGTRAKTIVLLDGYYHNVPAVTHKEILEALHEGVRVYGAASMGALRAAEMQRYGMVGVGDVFARFRDGILDGDDEVAILHTEAEHGYRPVTLALVDLRHALAEEDDLMEADAQARARSNEFTAEVKALPFTQRDPQAAHSIATKILGSERAHRLRARLRRGGVKRADAKRALRRALDAEPCVGSQPGPVHRTSFSGRFREFYLGPARLEVPAWSQPTYRKAWTMVQVQHPQAPRFVRALRARFLLASAADRAGLRPRRERVQEYTARLEAALAGDASANGIESLPLPNVEVREEAETQALADRARERFGSEDAALSFLAEQLGLEPERARTQLFACLQAQDDLMPAWLLVRACVFSSVIHEALSTAEACLEVYAAFRAWAGGRRVTEEAVVRTAAQLWNCSPKRVERLAARRGLFRAHGFSAGFHELVEMLVPAEKLHTPLNDYAHRKKTLARTPLRHVLDGAARTTRARTRRSGARASRADQARIAV